MKKPAKISLEDRLRKATWISYFVGAAVLVLVVAELVTFDRMIPLLTDYPLFGGNKLAASIVATVIVVAGVASLPYILGQRLKPELLRVSLVAGFLFATTWLVLLDSAALGGYLAFSSGLAGSLIPLDVGLSLLVTTLLTLGLVATFIVRGGGRLFHARKK